MARRRAIPEAQRFLAALFDQVPPDHYVLVWTLPEKSSHWYDAATELVAAAELVEAEKHGREVYVGAALSPKRWGRTRRCPAKEAAGLVALWADVDYADAVHRKASLPPDVDAAHELVNSVGLDPSVVVHSGHGLQAWWLFDEPWLFADDAERDDAATLVTGWQATLSAHAKERGWVLDATHDLARVLRIPGGLNHKSAPAVPVHATTLEPTRRYSIEDFRERLVDVSEWTRPSTHTVRGLVVRTDATPPFDKLELARTSDQMFDRTWRRTRRLKLDSPSEWDWHLTLQMIALNWTDQEMADTLVASRRMHGDDLKLQRADNYYARTIENARSGRGPITPVAEVVADLTDALVEVHSKPPSVERELGAEHVRHDALGGCPPIGESDWSASFAWSANQPPSGWRPRSVVCRSVVPMF